MLRLRSANIGNARIQGMAKDLDLRGYRFNWALSILYIIYLMVEVPSNVVLKRVGPRFYLPFLLVGFGFVSLCTVFVKDFNQLCVTRAFLGAFEGGAKATPLHLFFSCGPHMVGYASNFCWLRTTAMPGFAWYLSSFYKRRELYFRVGIYVSAASMAVSAVCS